MSTNYLIPEWPAPANVNAFSSTRCRGFSQAPFAQFNLATHVNDCPQAVARNQRKLVEDLQLPQLPLWLQQVHGTEVSILTPQSSAPIQADACITTHPNTVCAIMTADCIPLLVCNRQGTEVAAIHAGWRGLLTGVIENTIQALHSEPHDLLVWIGPAIGPKHFEINADIYASFVNKHPDCKQAMAKPSAQRWFADLFSLCRIILSQCGVSAIYGEDLCTYADPERFFSYRRDQGVTGRMASLIWLNIAL